MSANQWASCVDKTAAQIARPNFTSLHLIAPLLCVKRSPLKDKRLQPLHPTHLLSGPLYYSSSSSPFIVQRQPYLPINAATSKTPETELPPTDFWSKITANRPAGRSVQLRPFNWPKSGHSKARHFLPILPLGRHLAFRGRHGDRELIPTPDEVAICIPKVAICAKTATHLLCFSDWPNLGGKLQKGPLEGPKW